MKFNNQVVRFDFKGIPMIGNLNNGFAIGLSPDGAALCDDIEQQAVSREEALSRDKALAECLIAKGFCDECESDRGLKSAYLHVTQRCNLNCAGCYSYDLSRNNTEDASTADMRKAIRELVQAGCQCLFISGGEPFLREDLPQLLHYAKESGIQKITLITNGTCVCQSILKEIAGDVDVIAVSFDGYNSDCPAYIREEQRFDQLTNAIRMIQEAGIQAHITPTIHAKNYADLQEYVNLAQSLGTTMNYSLLSCDYSDDAVRELLPGEAELEGIADLLLAMGGMPSPSGSSQGINISVSTSCGAGSKELSIAADGTVYPCHMLHRSEWALGNAFEQPLSEILQSAQVKRLAENTIDTIQDCMGCEHRYLCGAGCRARSLYCYGDLNHKDAYCAMMKSYYDKLGSKLKQQFG